jgi:O-antigen/teichoic acid export membrane protein
LVSLFLAREYWVAVDLLPWIAGGYCLLVLSQVLEKVCFAHGRTGVVLFIQSLGGVVGLLVAYVGIKQLGLIGAAMAVPVYFGFQLLITLAAAQIVNKNAFGEIGRMCKKAVQNTEVEYHHAVQRKGK